MTVDELVNELGRLPILDAVELVKKLEKRWGVSSMRRIGTFVTSIIEEPKEEQTEFDVILENCGAKKIEIIKIMRTVDLSLGLKEAKDMVETPNAILLNGVSKKEAETLATRLVNSGATVRIV